MTIDCVVCSLYGYKERNLELYLNVKYTQSQILKTTYRSEFQNGLVIHLVLTVALAFNTTLYPMNQILGNETRKLIQIKIHAVRRCV